MLVRDFEFYWYGPAGGSYVAMFDVELRENAEGELEAVSWKLGKVFGEEGVEILLSKESRAEVEEDFRLMLSIDLLEELSKRPTGGGDITPEGA